MFQDGRRVSLVGLRENNIVLAKDTVYFYMKMLLEKHEDSYKFMLCRVGRDNVFENLCLVYEEAQPVNFGRVIGLLDFSL